MIVIKNRTELTSREKVIYDYYINFWNKNKTFPSIREVMTDLGYHSPSVVSYHLDSMVKKGFMTRIDNKSRGIRPNGIKTGVDSVLETGFTVADARTMKPVSYKDARQEDPALANMASNGMFAILEDGRIIAVDSTGKFEFPDNKRYTLVPKTT